MEQDPMTGLKLTIDIPSALERIGGDRSFLDELLNLYRIDFEEKYILLRQALAEGNFLSMQEIGHGLKGAAANLSLIELQTSSCRMEEAGREKNLALAAKSLEALEVGFKNLKSFLAQREPEA